MIINKKIRKLPIRDNLIIQKIWHYYLIVNRIFETTFGTIWNKNHSSGSGTVITFYIELTLNHNNLFVMRNYTPAVPLRPAGTFGSAHFEIAPQSERTLSFATSCYLILLKWFIISGSLIYQWCVKGIRDISLTSGDCGNRDLACQVLFRHARAQSIHWLYIQSPCLLR